MNTTKTEINKTSPLGLFKFSKEFYDAYKCITSDEDEYKELSTVKCYLICHSIELALKSYLRGCEYNIKRLKSIGHDLDRLLRCCIDENIKKYVLISEEYIHSVNMINQYYNNKRFEYIEFGLMLLPPLRYLENLYNDLYFGLSTYHHSRPAY